jgi:tRNA_anti-like
MTATKKYIAISIVLLASIAAVYAYKEFNGKPVDMATVAAQEAVTVANLISAYEMDEEATNAKYLGKSILANGNIDEINNQQDTLINVLLGNADDMHKVSCLLDKKQKETIKKYSIGDSIAIKGICTGFLADVELNRCVIVNNK